MSCKRKETRCSDISGAACGWDLQHVASDRRDCRICSTGQFISMYTKDESKLLPHVRSVFAKLTKRKKQLRVVYRVTGKGTEQNSFPK